MTEAERNTKLERIEILTQRFLTLYNADVPAGSKLEKEHRRILHETLVEKSQLTKDLNENK